MVVMLDLVPVDGVKGIYGASGQAFPTRAQYLHPLAAEWFVKLNQAAQGNLYLSDMFRSAESSLKARYPKGRLWPRRGVKPPAHSAHNFGLAIDVAVSKTLKAMGTDKQGLDLFMQQYGWHCHRLDHKRKSEEWHYNYLGRSFKIPKKEKRTSHAIERVICNMYEKGWDFMDAWTIQRCLKRLLFYKGRCDRIFGPKTRAAIVAFQRAWRLRPDAIVGPKTSRLLWYVVAELDFRENGPSL